ncbi:hypothetical protein KAT92_05960, partial [Candidatus Babeliales bacterium]|nr:hypothetical protein [Candidatus Babeliales bacterium]
KIKTHNINAVLKNRGVTRGVDFLSCKLTRDTKGNKIHPDNRPIAITKKTDKDIRITVVVG